MLYRPLLLLIPHLLFPVMADTSWGTPGAREQHLTQRLLKPPYSTPPQCPMGKAPVQVINFDQDKNSCEKFETLDKLQKTPSEDRVIPFLAMVTSRTKNSFKTCIGSIICKSVVLSSCHCGIDFVSGSLKVPVSIAFPWDTGNTPPATIPALRHCHPTIEKQLTSTPSQNWQAMFKSNSLDLALFKTKPADFDKVKATYTHLCFMAKRISELSPSLSIYHFAHVDDHPYSDCYREDPDLIPFQKLDIFKNNRAPSCPPSSKDSFCISKFHSSRTCNAENLGGPLMINAEGRLLQVSTLSGDTERRTCDGQAVSFHEYDLEALMSWQKSEPDILPAMNGEYICLTTGPLPEGPKISPIPKPPSKTPPKTRPPKTSYKTKTRLVLLIILDVMLSSATFLMLALLALMLWRVRLNRPQEK
ncbi:unnamed protein product [Cyprideis torosa]|uniref:Uncharacterized protein n=1 Tax=Cyprideis torosa TaxID=163714 RepID=A0A7R8WGW3_9CRUS|nr:unnamed protein product [Cyprideis torosa]CAG0895771.1 unnamed protein product [Cyprideis torosa]